MAYDNLNLHGCHLLYLSPALGAAQTQKGWQAMKRLIVALLVAVAVVLIWASNAG